MVILPDRFSLFYGDFLFYEPSSFQWEVIDFVTIPVHSPIEVRVDTIQKVVMSPAIVQNGTEKAYILWDGMRDAIRLYTGDATGWTKEIISTGKVKDPSLAISGNLIHCAWAEEEAPGVYEVKQVSVYRDNSKAVAKVISFGDHTMETSESPVIESDRLLFARKQIGPAATGFYDIYESRFNFAKFQWEAPVNLSNTESSDSRYPQLLIGKLELGPPGAPFYYIHRIWTEGKAPRCWIRYDNTKVNLVAEAFPEPFVLKGGTSEPSPYTVSRDTFIIYGTEPFQAVDYRTSRLAYTLPGLDPTKTYQIDMVFYHESSPQDVWEMDIEIEGLLDETIEVPGHQKVQFSFTLDMEEWQPPEEQIEVEIEGDLTEEQENIVDALVQDITDTRTNVEIEIEYEDGEVEVNVVGQITGYQQQLVDELVSSLGGTSVTVEIEAEFENIVPLLQITPGDDDPVVLSWFIVYETIAGEGGGGGAQTLGDNLLMTFQAFPNPTRGITEIGFQIPDFSKVALRIYDVSGRLVRTLIDDRLKPGNHTVRFDGRNLASGIYFARLTAGAHSVTKKLVLMK